MSDLEAAFLDNMQLRYFLDQIPLRTEHADLDKAKGNCRLFRQIGTTERYAEFTAAFIKSHTPIQSGKPFRLNRSRENRFLTSATRPLVTHFILRYIWTWNCMKASTRNLKNSLNCLPAAPSAA